MDDIVYIGSCPRLLEEFKNDMMSHYEMTNLGLLHHFLSMGVIQNEKIIFIHQKMYAMKLIEKFGLRNCKSAATSLAMNGKLCKVNGSEAADKSDTES